MTGLLLDDVYYPNPPPSVCPFVPDVEARKVAFDYGYLLDAIEQYDDGCLIRLEGVPVANDYGELRERIVPEAPAKLLEMNSMLAKRGFNAIKTPEGYVGQGLSPWWLKQIGRMYFARQHGGEQRNKVVIRGGRRSGKSISMCLVALYEALYGDHVPTLDHAIFMFLSAQKTQAIERISTIKNFINLIGAESLGFERSGDLQAAKIVFKKTNRMIQAEAATMTAVVSHTCFGVCCDEMAIWGNVEAGADAGTVDPRTILEQMRPTMLSQPNAWELDISAPWSTLDAHFEAFEVGNDNQQFAWHCPSWKGNPTVTKEKTQSLEKDPFRWQRQYAAIPLAADEQKFFPKPFVDVAFSGAFTGATRIEVA